MPSPLGHALGGLAAAWLIAPPRSVVSRTHVGGLRASGPFAAAAVAPDLDLLVGTHSTYTHSIGAVGLVLAAAVVWTRADLRWSLALAAAYTSHLLLDWLGSDATSPVGIMALWPFRADHYLSDAFLFDSISRRYWLGWTFVAQNATAILREIAILGPLALVAYLLARRRSVGAG